MNIVRRKNENLLIKEFISFFKKIQIKKRKKNTRLTFVLTGGTSPINLYKELSKIKIDWSNVDFFLVMKDMSPINQKILIIILHIIYCLRK